MIIKFRNLNRIIFGFVLGEIIGGIMCIQEISKISRLEKFGISTEVLTEYDYNDSPNDGYYNYYFIGKDKNKVRLSWNLNSKGLESDKKYFNDKIVKYNPLNPEEYLLLSKVNQTESVNYFVYFFFLPIMVSMIYIVIFPKKLERVIKNLFIKLGSILNQRFKSLE